MAKTPAKGKEGVGGYVPNELVGPLSLYCAINNISRAALVELVLTNLIQSGPSTGQMVDTIAGTMVYDWKTETTDSSRTKKQWKEFVRQYKLKLLRKKIPEKLVDEILTRAKREAFA